MYKQSQIEEYMEEYELNFEQMVAQILRQEIYCESGGLKHLFNDKKMEKFIKDLEGGTHEH